MVSRKVARQALASSPVVLNLFVMGLGIGWIAPTLLKLNDQDAALNITMDQVSWVASISDIGRIFGPCIAPWLVDSIGRKFTLIAVTTIFSMVWFSTIFIRNFYMLCTIRLTFGLGTGIYDVVSGIYLTENCSPNFRGIIGSIAVLTYFAGFLGEYIIATYLSYTNTAIVNTVIAASVFTSLYYCVETPYFLTMKGNLEKAKENLIWLSGNTSRTKVIEELGRIQKSVEEEKQKKQSLKSLFLSRANVKGIIVVVGMHIFVMGTGYSVFSSYGSLIFSPTENFTVSEFMILYGTAQLIAVALTPFIIEKINRRTLVIGSYIGVTGSNICSYLLIRSHSKGNGGTYYPWLIFGSITMYVMSVATMAPARYALRGELLPFSVRAIGSSLAVTVYSVSSFLVVKSFIPITQSFSMEGNFLIYSAVSLFATVFLYYVLPETRGKSLHELQNVRKTEHAMNNICRNDVIEDITAL